jgi:arylesterase / paraoxonase
MKRAALVAGAGLALAVAAGVVSTLVDAGAFRALSPHGFEQCARVDVTGSEDVVFDPVSGLVFVSSTDFRALDRGAPTSGAIWAWNPALPAAPARVPHDFGGDFHPHGLGLWRLEGGRSRLFVVNHPLRTSSTVELFDVVAGPALEHRRTIASDLFISMNDVAPVGPEAFYVTLDAGTRAGTAGRLAETFLRLPWAGVGFFDGATATVVASGMRYSNGIAVSGDGATVFVTESTGRRLMAWARDTSSGALSLGAEHHALSGLDNVALDENGRLWIGAHPKLLDFLAHASDATKRSPSQVLRARYDAAGRQFELEELGVDDGRLLSGSSVALPLGTDRVLVGSVFEHLLDCRLAGRVAK